MMLKQIVEQSGLNQPTCARLIQCLVELGYVSKFGPRAGYIIGPMAKAMGAGQLPFQRWGQLAEADITQLAQDTGEHTLLAILHRGKRHVLCSHSANPLISVRQGSVFDDDLYTTVTGRLLLAHAPKNAVDQYVLKHDLPGKAWDNIRSRKQLDECLTCIREHPQEPVFQRWPVLSIMAIPVLRDGKVVAALGMAAPTSTFDAKQQKRAAKLAFQTAATISEKLT
jgi:DNA-binding IclR family transcriptional regulator